MKTLCIRFDIDTPTCLREGVPRLLDLSESLGVRGTYFLSVGRSVSRTGALRRIVSGAPRGINRAVGFSARRKLGAGRYVALALTNPMIGKGTPAIVTRLAAAAEVGLHGGKNHDEWQHGADTWDEARLAAEVDWGLDWLRSREVRVDGFSSPGWNAPKPLPEILRTRGLTYRADRYGAHLRGAVEEGRGFVNIATNLLGEPGGVAYLEHLRARGMSDREIRAQFAASLRSLGSDVVLYDHPYFAGLHALELLRDLIRTALDEGFRLVTLGEMARSAGAAAGGET